LFELGKITQDQAETKLKELAEIKDDFDKAKTKAAKKISVKLAAAKTSTYKFKFPKIASQRTLKPPKLTSKKFKSIKTLADSMKVVKVTKPKITLRKAGSLSVMA
jgi:hypothetical protein